MKTPSKDAIGTPGSGANAQGTNESVTVPNPSGNNGNNDDKDASPLSQSGVPQVLTFKSNIPVAQTQPQGATVEVNVSPTNQQSLNPVN